MNFLQSFAAVFAVLALCHPSACEALAAAQVEASLGRDAKEDKPLAAATGHLLDGSAGIEVTMDSFALQAVTALEPLPILQRDNVAQLILFTNGFFGNLNEVAAAVAGILAANSVVLLLLPFGMLFSIMVQAVINLSMAPQTKFFVQYLLYRIWLVMPARSTDVYDVKVVNSQILVVSAVPSAPSAVTSSASTSAAKVA